MPGTNYTRRETPTETYEFNDREAIRSFMDDLGVEVPTALEEGKGVDEAYEMVLSIEPQGNYATNYPEKVVRNSEIVMLADLSIRYQGEEIERLLDTYEAEAQKAFELDWLTEEEREIEMTKSTPRAAAD